MNISPPKSRESLRPSRPLASSPWPEAQVQRMRQALAAWYAKAKRDLPWRRTRDAYAITVSELMLQQTQVVTVIPFYERWLARFPSWAALAEAPEEAVLKAWEGLGYYRRARNLHALAQLMVTRGGLMPQSGEELVALPGIGPYTAAAVGSIAFDLPLAVLDGNVMRVLTRLLAMTDDIARPQTRQKLQAMADFFLEKSEAGNHNQAVMELGATICLPGKPLCLLCPLQEDCRGRTHAQDFPVKTRIAVEKRAETIAILREGDRIYCEQVEAGKPWHGLWRLPNFDEELMTRGESLGGLRYGITKYAVTMEAVAAEWKDAADLNRGVKETRRAGLYLTAEERAKLAFAAPHRKLAGKIGGSEK